MTQNTNSHAAPDPMTIKWIRIIAFWTLITALLNLFFYGLVQFSVIKGSFSLLDHFDVMTNSLIGLLTFWGLRRHAPWGWKLAVVAIPASWFYGVYSISRNYQPGMGFVTSMFLFIDAAIFIFLFTPPVLKIFQIPSRWISLEWIKYPLLVIAVFLLSLDFLGNLGSIMAAFVFFIAFFVWNCNRQKEMNSEE